MLQNLPSLITEMPGGVPQEFLDWMAVPTRPFDFSNTFLYTLPNPRLDYYEHNSYESIQNAILFETNKVAKALGFYQLN